MKDLRFAAKCLLKATGTLLVALALVTSYGSAQTLHDFTGGADGLNPFGGLAIGKSGALYGTTEYGGSSPKCKVPSGCGTVFELKPPAFPGGAWEESVIYAFPGYSEPLSSPTVGPNGELYGTTYFGGARGVGSVFELVPPSSPGGTWTEDVLYSFPPAQAIRKILKPASSSARMECCTGRSNSPGSRRIVPNPTARCTAVVVCFP